MTAPIGSVVIPVSSLPGQPDQAVVRKWALAEGLPVMATGALPKQIVEMYMEAQR